LLTDSQIAAALSQCVRHLNDGRPDAAEPLLAAILSARPGTPQAMMLMGIVRLNQGRAAEAESLLSGALAASPAQPMVLFQLGNARRALGRLAEAADAWRAALAARPDFAEAALALGETLNLQEENAEAETALAAAQHNSADPDLNAQIENALGAAKLAQRRPEEALAHFDAALSLNSKFLPAERNRATALEYSRKPTEALASYRRVLAREPLDLPTHVLLNELLHRSGRESEMLTSYDASAAAAPLSPLPRTAKGDQLLILGRAGNAQEEYRRALAIAPRHVPALIGLARAQAAGQEHKAAIANFEAALRTYPGEPDVQTAFAYELLRQKDNARALKLAESATIAAPLSQPALAVLGLCYRALSSPREETLNNYDHFVQVFDLTPPEGYADAASFNRDLAIHLDELHADAAQFFSQTLRGGTRSFDEFFRQRHPLRDALKRQIGGALKSYMQAMKPDETHPFLSRRSENSMISGSWSSRMKGGGFHVNHIHSGWISSVYYVAVPDAAEDSTAKEGWLKFGEPSTDLGLDGTVRRMVQPKPGRLVLFPSYMWHGTVPFHSDETRTTIAFDVLPRP
jgi:tetratricopeptide (TPR) repeat protein